MEPRQAYAELERRFHRSLVLEGVEGILDWDASVMMPAGSSAARGEQMATVRVLAEELIASPRVADLIAAAGDGVLDPWQRANLEAMDRMHRRAAAVDGELLAELVRAQKRCEAQWRGARKTDDFSAVAGALETLIGRVREVATAWGEALGCGYYDALLDEHEPGLRQATVDRLFGALGERLPELRERALAAQRARPAPVVPQGPFSAEAQRRLGARLMEALGFDFSRGRLDVSAHPFCGGTPDDVRITTRYDEEDFASALMGVLHETGHALYEMGLPTTWRHQPVGRARGMATHESQSLFVEMQICRGLPFLEFAAPIIAAELGLEGEAASPANLHRLGARVEPGLIRVDADEVTYPAHVVFRYDLERALLSGDLAVADLPGAWNERMAQALGITPPDDRSGCLQDIHWFDGAFGYFPSYTLGALLAAQLREALDRDRPAVEDELRAGEFGSLRTWLGERIHGRGASVPFETLVEDATGAPLGIEALMRHLEGRYVDG